MLLAGSTVALSPSAAASNYSFVKCAVSYRLNGRVPTDPFAIQLFSDDLHLRLRLVIGPTHMHQFYVDENGDRDYTLFFSSDMLCREVLSSASIAALFRSNGVYIGVNDARQRFSNIFRHDRGTIQIN